MTDEGKGKFIWNGESYPIEKAFVVDLEGERHPIPSPLPSASIAFAPSAKTVAFQGHRWTRFILPKRFDTTFTLELTDGMMIEKMFPAFSERFVGNGVFYLAADGRVFSYIAIDPGDAKPMIEGWYFFSILDRWVWRYALKMGLQLEDAVRELNRMWRADEFEKSKRVGTISLLP